MADSRDKAKRTSGSSKATGAGKRRDPAASSKATGASKREKPAASSKPAKRERPAAGSKATGAGKRREPAAGSKATGAAKRERPAASSKATGAGKRRDPAASSKATGAGKRRDPAATSKATGDERNDGDGSKAARVSEHTRADVTGGSDHGADTRNRRRGGLSAGEAVERAREHLGALLGRRVEGVLGVDRDHGNWIVTAQVVELARIPNTTDVLGEYEATLDGSGEIVRYHRTHRYHRGQIDSGQS